jgi:hypothetical protein
MTNETKNYILRGLDSNGVETFYTGRAGSGWVSADQSEAFAYLSQEAARRKATLFNARMQMHGLRFIAVAA